MTAANDNASDQLGSISSDVRSRLLTMVNGIDTADDIAELHRRMTVDWINSGAPLWRTHKPATPPMHLVSYFMIYDPQTGRYLLVHHRNAGLLLPTGGHVEPDEDPWDTVVREADEELHLTIDSTRRNPMFLTATGTRGAGSHTDISLWFLVHAHELAITWYDEAEFSGIAWMSADQITNMPIGQLDPHMHRFIQTRTTTEPTHALE